MSDPSQFPESLKNEIDGNFRPTHVYKGQPCETAQAVDVVLIARSLEERAGALAVSVGEVSLLS